MEKLLQICVVNLLIMISKASTMSVCTVGEQILSYLSKACCHVSPRYLTTTAVVSTITLLVGIRKCWVVVVVVVAASNCVRLSPIFQTCVFRESNSDMNNLGQEGNFLCLVVGVFYKVKKETSYCGPYTFVCLLPNGSD